MRRDAHPFVFVSRRTGGLENERGEVVVATVVSRRTGGLEKLGTPSQKN